MTIPDFNGLVEARRAINESTGPKSSRSRWFTPSEVSDIQQMMREAPQVERAA